MKTIIFIFIAIMLTNCIGFVDHVPVYNIDSRVQIYVDNFFKESEKRGKLLMKNNLIVKVVPGDYPALQNAAGICTIYDGDPQRYVYIWDGALDYFDSSSDSSASERLVFHELGHAFGRAHVNYSLLMNPYCQSDVYKGSDSLRTLYVNELILNLKY